MCDGFAEVFDDEVYHFAAVVALGEHQGIIGIYGMVNYDHIAEFLHEEEILPCAEEVSLAYSLTDFFLIAEAGSFLKQETGAADGAVGTGIVAVA